MSLTDPHHDGSALHVSDLAPELGDTVAVWVRVPDTAGVDEVHVRATPDAEPEFTEAKVDRRARGETWWRADVELRNLVTSYRFLLSGPGGGYRWLNAAGIHARDVTDASDFALVTHEPPPPWVSDAVFYQIFPDRFANSGAAREWPSWARVSAWDEPVVSGGAAAMHQLYGGDLPGIEQRLDHLERLGVNAVYLTPFFPAESNHRYNASTFHAVDPLLGGDAALASLSAALHARGVHLIGDLTLNHSGDTHEWFETARADRHSMEAGFYHFRGHPDDYVGWLDVPTLPKFDHRSHELARRLYDGADSVVAHWLRAPFDLDGWRIDVANMTGRHGEVDRNQVVARAARRTVGHLKPDGFLVAEHAHDASADLRGDGWHGTMAYAAFTRPLWSWLARDDLQLDFLGMPVPVPRLPGGAVAATMRAFAAAIPWRSLTHSLGLLGSHDTSRFRTVTGDRDRAVVGAGLLMTWPTVPSIFAGDEVGLEGRDNEDARGPMLWDEDRWDRPTFDRYRELVALRRASPALRHGGFRWVDVGDDSLTFLRESADERLLVHAVREPTEPVAVTAAALGASGGGALLGGDDLRVEDGVIALPCDGPDFFVWSI